MNSLRESLQQGLTRRFWLLWAATTASGLGDGLVLVAFPLLAADLTDDPRLVVGVAVAAHLPWLLVSLPAGAWVDRVERRGLLARVEFARVAALVAFGAAVGSGHASLPLLFTTVFFVGAGQTVFSAGTFAALPSIVESRLLGRANGYLFATETATENVIGPALGGLVLGAGIALPFVLDGVSFALSGVLLLAALPRLATPVQQPTSHLRADLRDGWRYFSGQPLLRRLMMVIAVLAFAQAMVLAPLVLFALEDLGLSGTGYGVLLAMAALGNVIGGVLAGRVDHRFSTGVVLAGAGITSAVAYLALGLAHNPVLAGAALGVEGVAVSVGNVTSMALRQRVIPDQLLGRVGNIFRFFIYGAIPLGAMTGGLLASRFLRAPMLAAAIFQLGAILVLLPGFRRALRSESAPVVAAAA